MSETAVARLKKEREAWRDNPVFGFVAKPMKRADGTFDYLNFECLVKGKAGTLWEHGYYRVLLMFPEEYPSLPPSCKFEPPIFHPNVHPLTGVFYHPLLDKNKCWAPNITIKQILLGIQNFLDEPDVEGPHQVNHSATIMYCFCAVDYELRVKVQAIEMSRPGAYFTV